MESKFYSQAQEAIAKEDYGKAVKLLSKAINEQPKNANYYSHRGVSKFHLNDKKGSLIDMNKSVELDPEYGYRYASRAYIKSTIGDIEGAINDYEKAVALDPEDSVSFNNLGMMQEKLGYDTKSKDSFKKADSLAKLMEENGISLQDELKPRNIQQEINEEKKDASTKKVLLDVFRDKNTFKEFLQFIKNGFKNK